MTDVPQPQPGDWVGAALNGQSVACATGSCVATLGRFGDALPDHPIVLLSLDVAKAELRRRARFDKVAAWWAAEGGHVLLESCRPAVPS